jgi:hypothetical protein
MRSSIKQLIIISSFITIFVIGLVTTNTDALAPKINVPAAQAIAQNIINNRLMSAQLHRQHVYAISSAARLTTTTTAPVPTGSLFEQWTRVAVCEEGGWVGYAGPFYPNSLGINATNWYSNGGGSDVSPSAQIAVAKRLVASLGIPNYVPDQNGCAAW